MVSIQSGEVLEAVKTTTDQHFGVHTITIGIGLHDRVSTNIDVLNQNIYNKITTVGKDLVTTAEHLSAKYGVPIVNQRISVTPITQVAVATKADFYVSVARILDKAARVIGVSFIGGFSALVQKGVSSSDEMLVRSIPEVMKTADIMCSSIDISSTCAGTNTDTVKLASETIKRMAEIAPEGFGCAKVVVFCNTVEDNPFIVGAFHGPSEADAVISVGVSESGVARAALENSDAVSLTEVVEVVKGTAFKITRVGELIGRETSKILGIPSGILDLSLALTPAVGDSVAHILEEMDLSVCGTHGTTAALVLLNDIVKKGGIMVSSAVGGLSNAFVPVSEDGGMIAAIKAGVLTLGKLEVMTAVCLVELGVIVASGNTPAHAISGIIADEAAAGTINSKTTTVRIIPITGKTVGDSVEFGGLLDYAPMMPVKEGSCKVFVNHSSKVSAPAQSMKS